MGIENKVKYKYFILANFLTKKNANNTTKYYNRKSYGVFKHGTVSLVQLPSGVIKRYSITLLAR